MVAHDKGPARPDGQADEVVAIKSQEQVGDVRAHGVAQHDLVKAVGAFVHAGDVAGQRAEKLKVQRAVQQRQLVGVRIKGDIAALLFDHLKILPVVGLKRVMFHGPKTWRV